MYSARTMSQLRNVLCKCSLLLLFTYTHSLTHTHAHTSPRTRANLHTYPLDTHQCFWQIRASSNANLAALLRWGRTRYVLCLDRRRLPYGLREATAFDAPIVSMQLVPFDQSTGCFYHSSVWRKLDFFFSLSLSENVAAAKGLDGRPTLCFCGWHHRSSTGGIRYDDGQTTERRDQAWLCHADTMRHPQ